ncbi:MAG: Long-chain acyl-CoA synthetase [Segetibacter sp.]|nr:Long-chain acyl-CoA synthetase [Segetibacter sp.]
MLINCFSQPSDKNFLYTNSHNYSYGWLQNKIKKLTGLLKGYDLITSDRIVLTTTHDVEMSAIFITALMEQIGVTMVDLDTRQPRIDSIIEKVLPSLTIADIFEGTTFK